MTHTSLDKRDSAWAYASTFLTSSKRVKITLLEATLEDLHEDKLAFKSILPAEVVFQSRVYSPKAMSKWGFSGAIDERLVDGYYLPIQKYKNEGEAKVVNQTLFDSVVLDDESELRLDVTPYELDREFMYGVREITGHGCKESLEDATVTLPLEDGIYDIRSNEWSGRVKVEVL
jgi:hypothetical protein